MHAMIEVELTRVRDSDPEQPVADVDVWSVQCTLEHFAAQPSAGREAQTTPPSARREVQTTPPSARREAQTAPPEKPGPPVFHHTTVWLTGGTHLHIAERAAQFRARVDHARALDRQALAATIAEVVMEALQGMDLDQLRALLDAPARDTRN